MSRSQKRWPVLAPVYVAVVDLGNASYSLEQRNNSAGHGFGFQKTECLH